MIGPPETGEEYDKSRWTLKLTMITGLVLGFLFVMTIGTWVFGFGGGFAGIPGYINIHIMVMATGLILFNGIGG